MINCILVLAIITIIGCVIMPENQALQIMGSIIYTLYIIPATLLVIIIAIITAPKDLIEMLKEQL